jgi:hypothetical protein
LLAQHPGTNHSFVNQVTENSKIPFSESHRDGNSPYITAEQVNIPHVAIIGGHNSCARYRLHAPFFFYQIVSFVILAVKQRM